MSTFDVGLWDNGSGAFDVALVGTLDATIPNTRTPVAAVAGVTTPSYVGPPDATIDLRSSPASIATNGYQYAQYDNEISGSNWDVSTTVPGSDGDVIIARAWVSVGDAIATPSGWTKIGTSEFFWFVRSGASKTVRVPPNTILDLYYWAFSNVNTATPIDDYAYTSDLSSPYNVSAITATNSNDMEIVVWDGATASTGFTADSGQMFHKLMGVSGSTGTPEFTGSPANSYLHAVLLNAGGDGSASGLDIKVTATAAIPAPTVVTQTDATVPSTVTPVAAVTAITQPQSPATVTASIVSASTSVTTERPAISATTITAVSALAQPQSPATVAASSVTAAAAITTPIFHATITAVFVQAAATVPAATLSTSTTVAAKVVGDVAPIVRQSAHASTSSTNSVTATFGSTPIGGASASILVCMVVSNATVQTPPSGWAQQVAVLGAQNFYVYTRYSNGTESAVTWTTKNPDDIAMVIAEVTGINNFTLGTPTPVESTPGQQFAGLGSVTPGSSSSAYLALLGLHGYDGAEPGSVTYSDAQQFYSVDSASSTANSGDATGSQIHVGFRTGHGGLSATASWVGGVSSTVGDLIAFAPIVGFLSANIFTPTLGAGSTISASTVAAPGVAVPTTTTTASSTAVPSAIAGTTTIPAHTASSGVTITATLTSGVAAAPASAVHLYKMGAFKPNILYTLTNLTGTYTDIQDSPDTPDANALVPTGGAIVVRMGFEDHTSDMRTQVGDQILRAVVKVP